MHNGGCADRCTNAVGTFTCDCTDRGFTLAGDQRSCVDIDECEAGTDNCSGDQVCVNSVGTFVCIAVQPTSAGDDDYRSLLETFLASQLIWIYGDMHKS